MGVCGDAPTPPRSTTSLVALFIAKGHYMVSIADVIPLSNTKRAPVLLMDWKLLGIIPPDQPMPVPESPPPLPPEMPQPLEPLGAPPPTESPVPMREPPTTLPPQS